MKRLSLHIDSPTGDTSESQRSAFVRAQVVELRRLGRGGRALVVAALALLLALVVGGAADVAALALVALAGAAAGLAQPRLLGPLVLLLLPAGARLHVLDAQVAPLEAVVGGGALGFLMRLAIQRERLRLSLPDWVFAAFVVFVALGLLGSVDRSDRAREVLFWAALGILFHVVARRTRARGERTLLFAALCAATLVEATWALYEYVDRFGERFSALGGAIVFPLPSATLEHPNALAQFLVVAGLAVLALALGERGWPRSLGLAVAGASALALLVTFSRASWIAFVLGVSVYLADRRARRPVVALGVLAGAAAAALVVRGGAIGDRISSLARLDTAGLYDFRLELLERGASVVADQPLTGAGRFEEMGVYAGRADLATHPHNLFLGVAVFFGIPAALALGALVVLAARRSLQAARSSPGRDRLTGLGFVSVLAALVVNGLFEYPFWNPSLSVLIVVVLAAAVALRTPNCCGAVGSGPNSRRVPSQARFDT